MKILCLQDADYASSLSEDLQDMYIKPFIPKAVMLHMKDSKWAKNYMAKQQ